MVAIAQHRGMATRLIDWTESLLVAAFFAVINAGARSKSGIIYAVKDVPQVSPTDAEKPFDISDVRSYRPPHITSRIPAQRSVFTVHPDPTQDRKSTRLNSSH